MADGEWGGFVEFSGHSAGNFPDSAVPGDIDDDGDLDLVVGNYFGGDVSVLLGNGDGTFEHLDDFPVGHRTGSVRVHDFDGDGNLDVAALEFHTDKVAVLRGAGDGTFDETVSYPTGAEKLGDLFTGDLDNDGDWDFIAHSGGTNSEFGILMNNGDGSFVSVNEDFATHPAGAGPIVLEDLDGDGDQDFAIATAADTRSGFSVNVFLNNTRFNVGERGTIGSQKLSLHNLAENGVASQSSSQRSARFAASSAIDGDHRSMSRTQKRR